MESTKCFTSEGYISSKMSSVNQLYMPSSFEEVVGKLISTSLKEFLQEEHMLFFKREKEKKYMGCS